MNVCVIGGGAAGMMCATMVARKGHKVTLLEKNEKLGKKILKEYCKTYFVVL
ncbi:MAG: FAD-dependent oxidoreductase [Bacilli bacterium]|nr:FAD-dependent oxidoreductase [Bacilli bacterium]